MTTSCTRSPTAASCSTAPTAPSITGNDLRFNPNGIESADSSDLLIENNDASDSSQSGFAIGNGHDLVVRGNTANRTGSSGISLEGGEFAPDGVTPIGPALIEGNTANENLEDGISVASGGHVVRDNNGHNNAGYGISVDELNVDGGGNRASGNGRPEQCVGVVCNLNDNVPLTSPDFVAPVTIIESGPPDGHNGLGATFVFSATDDRSPVTAMVFECRVDPPPDPITPIEPPEPPEPGEPPDPDVPETLAWEECSSPHFYPQFFEAGDHRFEVRATDFAQNQDLTPEVHEWTVTPTPPDEGPDVLPPNTTIREAPDRPVRPQPRRRSCSAAATTARSAPTSSTCASSTVRPSPAARARKKSRSRLARTPSPCGRSTSPATPIRHPPSTRGRTRPPARMRSRPTPRSTSIPTPSRSRPMPRSASRRPRPARRSCARSTAWPMSPCPSPHALTSLTRTEHTLEVAAVDASGNTDQTPATFTWTIGAAPVETAAYCGQIVTESIVLTNDLLDCLVFGLVVGAPNITIDLGGYTVDGLGLAMGVRNQGFDNVTITNGTITGFDVGVELDDRHQRQHPRQPRPRAQPARRHRHVRRRRRRHRQHRALQRHRRQRPRRLRRQGHARHAHPPQPRRRQLRRRHPHRPLQPHHSSSTTRSSARAVAACRWSAPATTACSTTRWRGTRSSPSPASPR